MNEPRTIEELQAENVALKAEVARRKLETAIALQALTLIATPEQIHKVTSAIIAARLTPPAHGDAPAQKEKP